MSTQNVRSSWCRFIPRISEDCIWTSWTRTHPHIRTQTRKHINTHTHAHACMYTRTHTHTHTHTHAKCVIQSHRRKRIFIQFLYSVWVVLARTFTNRMTVCLSKCCRTIWLRIARYIFRCIIWHPGRHVYGFVLVYSRIIDSTTACLAWRLCWLKLR